MVWRRPHHSPNEEFAVTKKKKELPKQKPVEKIKRTSLSKTVHKTLRHKQKDIEEELLERNVRWDGLNQLNQDLRNIVGKFVADMFPIVEDKELLMSLPGPEAEIFRKLTHTFNVDISAIVDGLDNTSSIHKDKTGPIVSLDEYMEYMDISMRYETLLHTMIPQIQPVMAQILTCIERRFVEQAEQTEEETPTSPEPQEVSEVKENDE